MGEETAAGGEIIDVEVEEVCGCFEVVDEGVTSWRTVPQKAASNSVKLESNGEAQTKDKALLLPRPEAP